MGTFISHDGKATGGMLSISWRNEAAESDEFRLVEHYLCSAAHVLRMYSLLTPAELATVELAELTADADWNTIDLPRVHAQAAAELAASPAERVHNDGTACKLPAGELPGQCARVHATASPSMSTYWQGIATHYALTHAECDALAAHLATLDLDNLTMADTSAAIVADALKPAMVAASHARAEAIKQLEALTGASVGTAESITNGTLVQAFLTINGRGVRVTTRPGVCFTRIAGVGTFDSPATIPTGARKTKSLAHALTDNMGTRAVQRLIDAHDLHTELYNRWASFSRDGAL